MGTPPGDQSVHAGRGPARRRREYQRTGCVSPAPAGLQSTAHGAVAAEKPAIDVDPPCRLFHVEHRETESGEGLETEELPCFGLLAAPEPLLSPVGDGGAKSTVAVEKEERSGGVSGHISMLPGTVAGLAWASLAGRGSIVTVGFPLGRAGTADSVDCCACGLAASVSAPGPK
jgi:hypothetical protein